MREIDLSKNDRIGMLEEVLRDASGAEDPVEFRRRFGPRFRRLQRTDLYITVSTRNLPEGRYKITRVFRLDEPGDDAAYDTWPDWDSLPGHEGGFIGAATDSPRTRLFHRIDLSADPVLSGVAREMRSCIAVPLFDGGRALNWALLFFRSPDPPGGPQVEEALVISNLLGTVTRHLLALSEVKKLQRQQQAQLEEIARIQQSLLPSRIPKIRGLKIGVSYLTSDEAGGDYYDFLRFDDGTWGLIIADVSGHGAAAATLVAMLHTILQSCPHRAPHEILEYANGQLQAMLTRGAFVTAFAARFDPETAELSYARAGHPPPRRKEGRGGRVHPLDRAATVPLGVLDELGAETMTITLEPNDSIVMFTDGITEAFSPAGEMFGTERLDEALTGCGGEPECIVDAVHGALYRHTGLWTRDDDQTLVAFRYTPAPA